MNLNPFVTMLTLKKGVVLINMLSLVQMFSHMYRYRLIWKHFYVGNCNTNFSRVFSPVVKQMCSESCI